MATDVSKGTMKFVDTTKRGSAKIVVKAKVYGTPITKAKLDTLSDAILAMSDCGLKEESVLDIAREDSPTYAGNKDRKGVLVCQEPDGTIHKWQIPGIKAANCEIVANTNGERIKPADAATLAAAFATCTGLTLTALESPVIQFS
jgi:hypothetical protein